MTTVGVGVNWARKGRKPAVKPAVTANDTKQRRTPNDPSRLPKGQR